MLSEKTSRVGMLDSTKTLRIPVSHRAPSRSYLRPIVLLLIIVFSSPFLVTSVLIRESTPRTPLSEPQTADSYAPLTFPAPPYVEPLEPRTEDVNQERASRGASIERKQVSKVEIVISFALAQQGKRYVFGTKGPNTYDCSGLLVRAFAQVGMSLYHYTGTMMTYGQKVGSRGALVRGDIVFPSSGHVGIYLGGGVFVHASSGNGKVAITQLNGFYTARRLL